MTTESCVKIETHSNKRSRIYFVKKCQSNSTILNNNFINDTGNPFAKRQLFATNKLTFHCFVPDILNFRVMAVHDKKAMIAFAEVYALIS